MAGNSKSDKRDAPKEPTAQDRLHAMMSDGGHEAASSWSRADIERALNNLDALVRSQSVSTGPHEALTRIFTGQKMYVDTRDISIAPSLLMEGNWEAGITRIFQKFIKRDTVLLDVGANFGYFGIVAGQTIQSGHVYFIEANPKLIPFIERSVSVNGLDQITTISNYAASDKKGTLELNVLAGLWGSSSVADKEQLDTFMEVDYQIEESVKVDAISIDDYRKQNDIKRVDVIKLDIEGHEEAAYRGMPQTIADSDNLVVLLEFTENAYDDPKAFLKQMSSDFDRVQAIVNGTLRTVETFEQLQELMKHQWIMLVLSKGHL